MDNVVVDWNTQIGVSQTTPTIQVVVNPLLRRESGGIHDNIFSSLQQLEADYVRFVPW